jgi:hypothetical protein
MDPASESSDRQSRAARSGSCRGGRRRTPLDDAWLRLMKGGWIMVGALVASAGCATGGSARQSGEDVAYGPCANCWVEIDNRASVPVVGFHLQCGSRTPSAALRKDDPCEPEFLLSPHNQLKGDYFLEAGGLDRVRVAHLPQPGRFSWVTRAPGRAYAGCETVGKPKRQADGSIVQKVRCQN